MWKYWIMPTIQKSLKEHNDNNDSVSSSIRIPYNSPGKTWGDRIQLSIQVPSVLEQAPDFVVVLINPRHDPTEVQSYLQQVVRTMRQQGPVVLCTLLNFRDQREVKPPKVKESHVHDWIQQVVQEETSENTTNETVSSTTKETSEIKANKDESSDKETAQTNREVPIDTPTKDSVQDASDGLTCIHVGTASMKNCFGLNVLHHFIYQSYLIRKRLQLERKLNEVKQETEATKVLPSMSYMDFLEVLEAEENDESTQATDAETASIQTTTAAVPTLATAGQSRKLSSGRFQTKQPSSSLDGPSKQADLNNSKLATSNNNNNGKEATSVVANKSKQQQGIMHAQYPTPNLTPTFHVVGAKDTKKALDDFFADDDDDDDGGGVYNNNNNNNSTTNNTANTNGGLSSASNNNSRNKSTLSLPQQQQSMSKQKKSQSFVYDSDSQDDDEDDFYYNEVGQRVKSPQVAKLSLSLSQMQKDKKTLQELQRQSSPTKSPTKTMPKILESKDSTNGGLSVPDIGSPHKALASVKTLDAGGGLSTTHMSNAEQRILSTVSTDSDIYIEDSPTEEQEQQTNKQAVVLDSDNDSDDDDDYLIPATKSMSLSTPTAGRTTGINDDDDDDDDEFFVGGNNNNNSSSSIGMGGMNSTEAGSLDAPPPSLGLSEAAKAAIAAAQQQAESMVVTTPTTTMTMPTPTAAETKKPKKKKKKKEDGTGTKKKKKKKKNDA